MKPRNFSALLLLQVVLILLLGNAFAVCNERGTAESGTDFCKCYTGISGDNCDQLSGNPQSNFGGLNCEQLNLDNCLRHNATDSEWARFALCATSPETIASRKPLTVLSCLEDSVRLSAGPSVEDGPFSIQTMIRTEIQSRMDAASEFEKNLFNEPLALAEEFFEFGIPKRDRKEFGLENAKPLSISSAGAFRRANFPMTSICSLPCPCKETRDENGDCISGTDELLHLETYVAYGRCASIGLDSLSKKSITSPAVFMTRAITCLNTMSSSDESIMKLRNKAFEKCKRVSAFLSANSENEASRVVRLYLELEAVNAGFRDSFWDGTKTIRETIFMPDLTPSAMTEAELETFIKDAKALKTEMQFDKLRTTFNQGASGIKGALDTVQSDIEKGLDELRIELLKGFRNVARRRNEANKLSKSDAEAEQETLSKTIDNQLASIQTSQVMFQGYQESLSPALLSMTANNQRVIQLGGELAIMELVNSIFVLQAKKIEQIQKVSNSIMVLVSVAFSSFKPVVDPNDLVEQLSENKEMAIALGQIADYMVEMNQIRDKYDAMILGQLDEIRLINMMTAVMLERVIEYTGRITDIIKNLSEQQSHLLKMAAAAMNSLTQDSLRGVSSEVAALLPSTWDTLEVEVHEMLKYGTGLCKPTYLPPEIDEAIQEALEGDRRRLSSRLRLRGVPPVHENQSENPSATIAQLLQLRSIGRALEDNSETCTLSMATLLEQKNPMNPNVAPIAKDLLEEPTEKNQRKKRVEYFKALDELNSSCADVLTSFSGMVAAGRQMHHLVDRLVLSLSRFKNSSAKLLLFQDLENSGLDIEQELEQILRPSGKLATGTLTEQTVGESVKAMLESLEEEQMFSLVRTASQRLLDFCNTFVFARPDLAQKLQGVCKPVTLNDGIKFDIAGVEKIINRLQAAKDALYDDALGWDAVSVNPNAVEANGLLLNVTGSIAKTQDFGTLSANGFRESFTFDLPGPLTWLPESQGGIDSKIAYTSKDETSGPYFCGYENVVLDKLGILFTDENDKLLGHQGSADPNQKAVKVKVTLGGVSYKTSGTERLQFNTPSLSGIPFSYNVANEYGDCSYGGEVADFNSQLCYGTASGSVSLNGIPVQPSPYRKWSVEVTEGHDAIAGAKKVWLIASLKAISNPSIPCYEYPPPQSTWTQLLRIDTSECFDDCEGDDDQWWVILLGCLGGASALAAVGFVVYRKRRGGRVASKSFEHVEKEIDRQGISLSMFSKGRNSSKGGFQMESSNPAFVTQSS